MITIFFFNLQYNFINKSDFKSRIRLYLIFFFLNCMVWIVQIFFIWLNMIYCNVRDGWQNFWYVRDVDGKLVSRTWCGQNTCVTYVMRRRKFVLCTWCGDGKLVAVYLQSDNLHVASGPQYTHVVTHSASLLPKIAWGRRTKTIITKKNVMQWSPRIW